MKMKTMLALALLTLASPAVAHDVKGQHGGRVVDAGDHHVELVIREATVDVYVRDAADKTIPIDGLKAVAILAAGGKSQRVVLEQAGDKLTGKAAGALPAQAKGVVQLGLPGGKTVNARFN
jgi:hypothetical protein